MGIEITGDERDRKREGAIKEAKYLKDQALRGNSEAARALTARIAELDQTTIHNPNPAKVYRMANGDKKSRIGQLKGLGYSVTPLKDKAQAVKGYENDGAQTVGSMILMETTRENYERRRKDKALIYEMQTGAVNEKAAENIDRAARDGGFISQGESITFDESSES